MTKSKKKTSKTKLTKKSTSKKNTPRQFKIAGKSKWVFIFFGFLALGIGSIWFILNSKTIKPTSMPSPLATTISTPSLPRVKPRSNSHASLTAEAFYSKLEKLGSFEGPIVLASGEIDHPQTPMKYIFALPAHWKFYHFDELQELIQKSSVDLLNGPCIMIAQGKTHSSLKSAILSETAMMDPKTNSPYLLKVPVEIEISGIPTQVSKLSSPPLLNVLIVKNKTFTLLIRSCANTPEDDFYRIIGNIQIEPLNEPSHFDENK